MNLLVTANALLSAPASDDEGSTAATDGSTLRTSPAEHGGSVGSESGGSAVDSVAGEHSGEGPAYEVVPVQFNSREKDRRALGAPNPLFNQADD